MADNQSQTPKNNFFKDERFYIHGKFDDSISTEILPNFLNEIARKSLIKNSSIEVYINSDGGCTANLKDMLGVFEMAKSLDITVKTYVFGGAYSCGSILAAAGSKGFRFVGEHAEHLCHLGSTGGSSITNETEADRIKQRMDAHFIFLKKLYRKYANIKKLDMVLRANHYFIRGQDILLNGLADKIIP